MYCIEEGAAMKSILITALMFLGIIAAIHFGVFNALSSKLSYIIATLILICALFAAFKVLGNPLKREENRDEK